MKSLVILSLCFTFLSCGKSKNTPNNPNLYYTYCFQAYPKSYTPVLAPNVQYTTLQFFGDNLYINKMR